jgi:hypothetical protein
MFFELLMDLVVSSLLFKELYSRMPLNLSFKHVSGRTFTLDCELTDTVKQLKGRILALPEFSSTGITTISLILGGPNPPGVRMNDTQTLSQAGVNENLTINVIPALRGNTTGGKRKKSQKKRSSRTRSRRHRS